MTNPYYQEQFQGQEHQLAVARHTASELRKVEAAFDRLPSPVALSSGGLLFITTEGPVNAYIADLPTLNAYADGVNFLVRFHETNTRASTINVSALGPREIITLFERPAEAGDLRNIRRLTYYGGRFVMQTIARSDLYRVAGELTANITQGAPGIPGASTVFRYNRLAALGDLTTAGQYRFLMTPTGTEGVTTHTGFVMAGAIEIYDADAGGTGRGVFYGEVALNDILVFFVRPRHWYAYTVSAILAPRSARTRLWQVELLAYEAVGGMGGPVSGVDVVAPTAIDQDISFRWSRARAAAAGIKGVTGDSVIPNGTITFHSEPADYSTPPAGWPVHPAGTFFRNNAGATKVMVYTIIESGSPLNATEHDGYIYKWLRNGMDFLPALPIPF